MCVCMRVCACVRVCVRVCVRSCVRAFSAYLYACPAVMIIGSALQVSGHVLVT